LAAEICRGDQIRLQIMPIWKNPSTGTLIGRQIVFDLDGSSPIARPAMASGGAQKAIRELMREAVSTRPGDSALGEPKKAGIDCSTARMN